MVHRRSHHRRSQHRRRGSKKNLLMNGLENVGSSVQTVARKSAPALKNGFNNLFGLLSKGVNTGVQEVRSLTKGRRRRHRGTRRH